MKPRHIELNDGAVMIPILYEDRSVLALDKPGGWMLAPDSWDHTGRNLQLALQSSLNARDFWAHSRNLKYLRFIHRLDAETTGLTLFAKSAGALRAYSELFEERQVEKKYLVVVEGQPKEKSWTCTLPLAPDPSQKGRMLAIGEGRRQRIPPDTIKESETHFRVLETKGAIALIEAKPTTGRTHQIRVHLAAAGYPVVGDPLYGNAAAAESKGRQKLALRAVQLNFRDPFTRRMVIIRAPNEEFLQEYGFAEKASESPAKKPTPAA